MDFFTSAARRALGHVALCLTLLPALSCSSSDEGFTHVLLISEINMVLGEDDGGRLEGLNLDDRVDESGIDSPCGKTDGTAPDGRQGIDNQISILGSLLISQLGGDPDALIQSSINDGRMLIIVELEDLQDLHNDDNVTARIHIGTGPVAIGTDGLPEPGQSFDIRGDSPEIVLRNLRLRDGRIEINPFDINIKVDILQAMFDMTFLDTHLGLNIDDEGDATGLLGGGVAATMIEDIIANDEVLRPTLDAARILLRSLSDLEVVDERCTRVSAGMSIRAVEAFLLPAPDTP